MVLTLIPDTGNTTQLAQLADKVMEIAAPTISSINMQMQTELEQLQQEVAELKVMVQTLQVSSKPPRRRSRTQTSTRCVLVSC